MFGIGKKKGSAITLTAPTAGYLADLSASKDPVFAAKTLGEGFYIKMEEPEVFAPVSGTVTSIFPTNHAICIKTDEGAEILVHIGIDTNAIKPGIIESSLKVNDHIKKGSKIAEVDLQRFDDLGIPKEIYVFILNSQDYSINKCRVDEHVYEGDRIVELAGRK